MFGTSHIYLLMSRGNTSNNGVFLILSDCDKVGQLKYVKYSRDRLY